MSLERNIKKGHCFVCGCIVEAKEGFRRSIRGRGYRVVCPRHSEGVEYYHGSEVYRADKVGTTKKSALAKTTVGIEWEMENLHSDYDKALAVRGALERAGFALEHDGSLADGWEAPSPKCEGVKSLSSLIHSMAIRGEDVFLKGEDCGMHIHAYAAEMDTYRNWYHTLFVPFCEWIDSHNMDFCQANFGGKFRGYAHKITRSSNVREHSNFVNMQHDHTIEWRIPRYVSACQTVVLLKFWRKVLWMLNTTDWKKDADFTTRREVAVKASQNIIKIAEDTFEHGDIDKLNRMTI